MGTDTNEGPTVAYLEDFGLPPASVSFSEQTLVSGQFWSSQVVSSLNTPYLDVPIVPKQPKTGVYSPYPGSCLASVQFWIKDFPKGVGRPDNLTPEIPYPVIGHSILTTEGPVGHIGMVTDVRVGPSSVEVVFQECNFIPGRCGTRTLLSDSPVIRGYK